MGSSPRGVAEYTSLPRSIVQVDVALQVWILRGSTAPRGHPIRTRTVSSRVPTNVPSPMTPPPTFSPRTVPSYEVSRRWVRTPWAQKDVPRWVLAHGVSSHGSHPAGFHPTRSCPTTAGTLPSPAPWPPGPPMRPCAHPRGRRPVRPPLVRPSTWPTPHAITPHAAVGNRFSEGRGFGRTDRRHVPGWANAGWRLSESPPRLADPVAPLLKRQCRFGHQRLGGGYVEIRIGGGCVDQRLGGCALMGRSSTHV